jgi:hypothetical protein
MQLRYIGKKNDNYVPGHVYDLTIAPMKGKIYKDGIGVLDTRIMIWTLGKDTSFKVYNEEDFKSDFEPVDPKIDKSMWSLRSFV